MAVHTVNITLDEGADIVNVLEELVKNMPEVAKVETLDGVVVTGDEYTNQRVAFVLDLRNPESV
jgi:predicted methyltransferase